MNILLVIDNLGSGGAQRQIKLLASGLVERGHSVTLFLYHPDDASSRQELKSKGVRIVSSHKRYRFDLGPVTELSYDMRRECYNVAAAFMPSPMVYLLMARGLRNTPPLIMSHRRSYASRTLPLSDRPLYSLFTAARFIVANSYKGAEQIVETLPFLGSKMRVVPNGVELERFRPVPSRPQGGPVLLFVARLSPEKNVHRLLSALDILRKQGKVVPKILWAGRYEAGKMGEAHAAEIQQSIAELGLSSYWEPLGERLDIPALLTNCDALILPSRYEGTPNVVCEALAAARPVLASRVGDIGRMVIDGVSGFTFDPMKAEDIAKSITQFYSLDVAARDAMGVAGRRYAEEKLSVAAFLDGWEICLREAAVSPATA